MFDGSTAETSSESTVIANPVPDLGEEPTAGVFLNATIVCVDEELGSLELRVRYSHRKGLTSSRSRARRWRWSASGSDCRIGRLFCTRPLGKCPRRWAIVWARNPPTRAS